MKKRSIVTVLISTLLGCKSLEEPRKSAKALAVYAANLQAAGSAYAAASQDLARARARNIHEMERNAEESEGALAQRRTVAVVGNRTALAQTIDQLLTAVRTDSRERDEAAEREVARTQRIAALDANPGFDLDKLAKAGQDLSALSEEKKLEDEILFQAKFWIATASTISASLKEIQKAKEAALEKSEKLSADAEQMRE